MSDRPAATNGKRNRAWGTRDACPACGQCLCFACHPTGPCLDESDRVAVQAGAGGAASSRRGGGLSIGYTATWLAGPIDGSRGVSPLKTPSAFDAAGDRLR